MTASFRGFASSSYIWKDIWLSSPLSGLVHFSYCYFCSMISILDIGDEEGLQSVSEVRGRWEKAWKVKLRTCDSRKGKETKQSKEGESDTPGNQLPYHCCSHLLPGPGARGDVLDCPYQVAQPCLLLQLKCQRVGELIFEAEKWATGFKSGHYTGQN